MRLIRRASGLQVAMIALAIVSCAPAQPSSSSTNPSPGTASSKPRAITIGITSTVQAIGLPGSQTPTGGWIALTEVHTDGLVTSDVNSRRPVGRLAEKVPSVDDGSVTFLADGRMRVVFTLRRGITWQDGAPFTADDLVFSYQLGGPTTGIPTALNRPMVYIDTAEAPDDLTFVITYKTPFYQGATLGPWVYWPVPRHLLGEAFERFRASKDASEILNMTYWTSDYVQLGPFRLTEFDPAAGMTFRAYENYYLSRPSLDTIYVKIFGQDNVLFASLQAGAVDAASDNTLRDETGATLKRQWEASGEGVVRSQQGSLRVLIAQLRPDFQVERSLLDPRVRGALLQALDRDAIGEVTSSGDPSFAAWSILAKSDPLYPAAQDGLRRYPYSPDQTRAILAENGWHTAPDGTLRSDADGHQFHTAVYTSVGNESLPPLYASYWRTLGMDVEEHVWTAVETRSDEARSHFPGFDTTAGGVTGTLEQPPSSA
ncbi:MAG TPA: ABC transporter substrate-binding protein, partial [Chloroflexota bacterium]